jgi:homoserine/homoserine lactone efflux protein
MTIETWLGFCLAALVISISLGAGAVNTMSNGLQYGVRNSLPAILGLQLGYGAQILLVGVGLGAMLASSSLAFTVIKWFGVSYLLWLGYKKWTQPPLRMTADTDLLQSQRKRFWLAAFVNLTNPKATLFLLALFPQFLDLHLPQAPQFSIMGITLILVDIGVMLGYATLAAQFSHWMKSERHQIIQNRIFGALFIGAASLMAAYRRN